MWLNPNLYTSSQYNIYTAIYRFPNTTNIIKIKRPSKPLNNSSLVQFRMKYIYNPFKSLLLASLYGTPISCNHRISSESEARNYTNKYHSKRNHKIGMRHATKPYSIAPTSPAESRRKSKETRRKSHHMNVL